MCIRDSLSTSDEERLKAKKAIKEVVLNYEKSMQVEVSERWRVDMQSDSWLSKNIRPMVLIFLCISTILLIFIDKLEVKINLSFSKNKSLLETSIRPILLLINIELSKLILPFKTLNSSLASLKISSFFVDSIFTKVCTLIFSLNNKPDLINSLMIEFGVNKLEIL